MDNIDTRFLIPECLSCTLMLKIKLGGPLASNRTESLPTDGKCLNFCLECHCASTSCFVSSLKAFSSAQGVACELFIGEMHYPVHATVKIACNSPHRIVCVHL